MRIVIDLQGAQTHSRLRGIGRYTLSLTQAIVRKRKGHEIFLVLSSLLPEAILEIRASFEGLLEQDHIVVWHAPGPVLELNPDNDLRRRAAQLIREAFIASLQPDLVHIMSFFEGFGDDAVTSIGELDQSTPVSVILYDLIPLLNPEHYLQKNPLYDRYYRQKITYLKRASICLAISESSRQEGIHELGLDPHAVVNISTAGEAHFAPVVIDDLAKNRLYTRYGIERAFLMYTGGIDYRKNVEGLIRAYALLPVELRRRYQLLIVCSIGNNDRERLLRVVQALGLEALDVIFTGRVSEEDLVFLYNLCTLFVFPSLHEGFGLPVLEAMACGAPVIASNTSSLPEVVGNGDALFDPRDDQAIANKMAHVLTDESLRLRLAAHGPRQASQFSWERCACLAIEAWEQWFIQRQQQAAQALLLSVKQSAKKPKLAFISPLPPARSGISDYSAQLLPELARYYEIEIIALQKTIEDEWILANCPIRSIEWFFEHADEYARVLYHFGNSTVHTPQFSLLKEIPGVVVLHDFFLSGIVAQMESTIGPQGAWAQNIYQSHGYQAVYERYHASDTAQVVWKYPCNLPVLQNALGTIVHSTHSRQLFGAWYGQQALTDCTTIPLLRLPPVAIGRAAAREQLSIAPQDFVICSFGILGKSKLNLELLKAWLASDLAQDLSCHLIFVGDSSDPSYEEDLQEIIAQSACAAQIKITGWTSAKEFQAYLEAADIAVQLRTLSRGETSAAVLDCLNYGLPTIVNAHGSLGEFSSQYVYSLPDAFSIEQLTDAIHTLWSDAQMRESLSVQGRQLITQGYSPSACALQYVVAIEAAYEKNLAGLAALYQGLGQLLPTKSFDSLGLPLARAIGASIAPIYRARQILVDVSELVGHDSKTGIQRVVRSVLNHWLHHPPNGFRIEPVYASTEQGYRYARQFTLGFLDCPNTILTDEPIAFYEGDHFLGLDLQPQVVMAQAHVYKAMREQGVRVQFVVYDLLPLIMPQFFFLGADQSHEAWLKIAAQSDSLLCISRAVAQEVDAWKQTQTPISSCEVSWFHLGADVKASVPSVGLPLSSLEVLKQMREHTSFLMVGTLEPRKGQEAIVKAFEVLWEMQRDYCLVIVGKPGWLNERFIRHVEMHPEFGQRLIWLDAISDEYLDEIYGASDCLIAASEGEGFGLPLIEAAQYGLPIIARDIPVFREVASEYAFYFSSNDATVIAQEIERWMGLFSKNAHPVSTQIPSLTWAQSAEQLLALVVVDRKKPRLAFVSPLPPERTGIADYAGDLLPALSNYYDIVLIHEAVGDERISPVLGLPIQNLAWFMSHAHEFERVIYQFGNSPFHSYMLALLRSYPGVVVLHDFFLSGLWDYCELARIDLSAWSDALYYSHGYGPMLARFQAKQDAHVRNIYPANLEVLERASSVIVHSEHAKQMAQHWYGPKAASQWHCIPLLRTPPLSIACTHARETLGIDPSAFVVCSFGFVAHTKFSQALLDAWLASKLASKVNCQLIFVGQNHGGAYGQQLSQTIEENPLGLTVTITGWVDKEQYELYLQAADVGVQLRCDSRGETSAAVLDCLNFGLPTIINCHGSMAEINSDAAYVLEEVFTQEQLVHALETLHSQPAERERLRNQALYTMRYDHDPRSCAAQYAAVIEANYYARYPQAEKKPAWVRNLPMVPVMSAQDQAGLISSDQVFLRQLLVDVSEISRSDLHSGIERVVRAQLAQLLAQAPAGFRVEPVYLGEHLGKPVYRYARNYVTDLFHLPLPLRPEMPVRVNRGDIFYGADFCPVDVIKAAHAGIYDQWRQAGVKISFVVYDLLPILHPQFFPPTVDERHIDWLSCIGAHADQLIAISQTVAKDVQDYFVQHPRLGERALRIDYVHQGADINASFPTTGLAHDAAVILDKMASKPTFLMVGTIEPRKGVLQALAAFEQLWANGEEVQLLLVGKEGWVGLQAAQRRTLPQIMQTVTLHPELGKRLLWLPEVSDQYLQKIYGSATCLLMASEGEGFGLPLIEAATFNRPILARKLPVFQEIAGEHATYFEGLEPQDISDAIVQWLARWRRQQLPCSERIEYLSWEQNAEQVMAQLLLTL